jgi:hypothetical protein
MKDDAFVVSHANDAARAAAVFPQYRKLIGWLSLVRLGFPTLRGVIVTRWSADAEALVSRFLEDIGQSELTVRSDTLQERGDYPPGGDVIPLNELPAALAFYLRLGRVVFLLEPRSRFEDLYSLSVGYLDASELLVEAVGPGFDASDLNRGETSPHEWWRLGLGEGLGARVIEHGQLSDREYRSSWKARVDKVARLAETQRARYGALGQQTRSWAIEWLRANGHTLLIGSERGYRPIPDELLATVLKDCEMLPSKLRMVDLPADSFVVSMSFFGLQAEPIYWDITWPRLKFDLGRRPGE